VALCLWLGDNDVTLSMVKRAYQNFNSDRSCFVGSLFLEAPHDVVTKLR
jgi:hypothetical protein